MAKGNLIAVTGTVIYGTGIAAEIIYPGSFVVINDDGTIGLANLAADVGKNFYIADDYEQIGKTADTPYAIGDLVNYFTPVNNMEANLYTLAGVVTISNTTKLRISNGLLTKTGVTATNVVAVALEDVTGTVVDNRVHCRVVMSGL